MDTYKMQKQRGGTRELEDGKRNLSATEKRLEISTCS